ASRAPRFTASVARATRQLRSGPGDTIPAVRGPRGSPSVPVGRSLDRDVTSAQRVRLVVALGILNLILASVAFAVGIGAPRQPEGQIAEATSAPSPALTSANESPDLGTPGPTPPRSGDATAP